MTRVGRDGSMKKHKKIIMPYLVKITVEQVIISESMLLYATNDEVRQIHQICDRVIKRKRELNNT